MASAKKVEVVCFFNGARDKAKVMGGARTMNGVRRLVARAPKAEGWGCEVRGGREILNKLGMTETECGAFLVLDASKDRLVGCVVV